VFGVPSKETGMLVEEVVRKTVVMRSKTTFQTSTSKACLTTRRDSARWC